MIVGNDCSNPGKTFLFLKKVRKLRTTNCAPRSLGQAVVFFFLFLRLCLEVSQGQIPARVARPTPPPQPGGPRGLHSSESAFIREAVAAQELRSLKLHAGQKASQLLVAVVIQGGGIDGLGVFGVDDGGAEEAGGFVAGLEAHLGLVVAPCAVGDASDRLAAGGHGQAQGQLHVIDEVPL